MKLRFEWDSAKAATNFRKHGVSFNEARSIFLDPIASTIEDPEHSSGGDRYVTLGVTIDGRLLVVVHTDVDTNTVRIISARRATAGERKNCEED